ncbi:MULTISPECIES: hypothetical protein [Streptomyces]|uniref:hypothetical protein n=1 Tax=Streptomyces TaxID=1883 RepID=UPI0006EBC97E|nr:MULTISPECIES: hypothetical protein [Streptomyces]MCP3770037.1 hypothetical protein [Streptomyces sp. MAR25Y5]OBQ54425.1 hypothetical protein A4U61_01160 [Streptomyces sp. H-KF8]
MRVQKIAVSLVSPLVFATAFAIPSAMVSQASAAAPGTVTAAVPEAGRSLAPTSIADYRRGVRDGLRDGLRDGRRDGRHCDYRDTHDDRTRQGNRDYRRGYRDGYRAAYDTAYRQAFNRHCRD